MNYTAVILNTAIFTLPALISKVKDMKPNYSFSKVSIGPEVIEVVNDLSSDQHRLYRRWKVARSGNLSRDVALSKSGPIVHSRWLTTAETFLEMWEFQHGINGELLQRLETIVTFIVTV